MRHRLSTCQCTKEHMALITSSLVCVFVLLFAWSSFHPCAENNSNEPTGSRADGKALETLLFSETAMMFHVG